MENRCPRAGHRMIGLMVLILMSGLIACDFDDDDPAGPDGADPTPTPVWTFSDSYQLVVQARADGLYCIGDGTESRMLPWPLLMDELFTSSAPRCEGFRDLKVLSTDEPYTCPAGTFDPTVQIGLEEPYSYTDFGLVFKEGYGILGWDTVAGRSYSRTALSACSIAPGNSDLDDRFGLAPGNRWVFDIHGSDSNGYYRTEGTETRICSSKTDLHGQDVYVIQVTVETSTYGPESAAGTARGRISEPRRTPSSAIRGRPAGGP